MTRKFIVHITILASLLSACKLPGIKDQPSQVLGKVPSRTSLIARPKPVSDEVLEKFSVKIRSSTVLSSDSSATTPALKKQRLGAAYVQTLEDVAYIPREQGQKVFATLLSDKSTACGGASCRRVFGIKPQETEDFFDHTLAAVGSSAVLAAPAKVERKKRLIEALTPENDGSKKKKAWQDIADLYLSKPRILPNLVAVPDHLLSHRQVEDLVGARFTYAVNDYTRGDTSIRRVESSTDAELQQVGYSIPIISRYRQTIRILNDGLSRLPSTNVTVYRGMNNLSAEDISNLVTKWKNKTTTYLGPNGLPALTSASWDLKVAKGFANSHKSYDGSPRFFVIMVLRNHRGVPIENVSIFPDEHEVLIPSRQGFMIESVAPIANDPLGFVIYLRGVNTATGQQNQRPKDRMVA